MMPTRRVPRGAYERSCTECGWSAVYATEGMANSRMRRHDCTTYLRHAKRRTMTERYSAIDRTPKPCHHKRANHQHGTYACYTLDGCRCVPCADAQSAYETNRTRQQAYGRWDNLVDAAPARAHVAALGEYGISLKQVARLTGISTGTLSKLVYGHYKPTGGPSRGRYGKGELLRGPSERVSKRLAEKVLAVELRPENLAASALDPHRTDEARTKLRSLLRIGWSMSRIGARLGMPHVRNATLLIKSDRPMMRRTVDAALMLFDELCMTPYVGSTGPERAAAVKARQYAEAQGWAAPLELLDVAGDSSEEPAETDFDEVAVQRRLAGDLGVPLTRAERREVVRLWVASGRPAGGPSGLASIGIKPKTAEKDLARARKQAA